MKTNTNTTGTQDNDFNLFPPQVLTNTNTEAEKLARLFHDTYENLAPQHGYETRDDTKQFDPTTPNGQLMIAVAQHVIDQYVHQKTIEARIESLEWALTDYNMPDTDTAANLEQFISELKASLNTGGQK